MKRIQALWIAAASCWALALTACEPPPVPAADAAAAAEAGPNAGADAGPDGGDDPPPTDIGRGADVLSDALPPSADGGADLAAEDVAVDPFKAEAAIGPAGGSVVLPSGARVLVPPGALQATVQISIAAQAPPPPADLAGAKAVGPALLLGPEGQTFLQPVQVRVPLDKAIAGNVDWAAAQLLIAPQGSTAFVALDSAFGTDELGAFVTAETTHFSWAVPALPAPGAVFITTASLPSAAMAKSYGPVALQASGGAPPYSWSVPAGGLPAGLTLSTTGVLSGVPSAAGAFGFAVRCSDATGKQVEKAYSVVVAAVKPTLTAVQPPQLPQGSPETAVTLIGSQFVPGSLAYWSGLATPLASVLVAPDKLQVTLQAALLAAPGQGAIFVKNPDGAQSNTVAFQVTAVAQNPLPKITALQPQQLAAGAVDTQITVVGTGFLPTSLVTLDEQGLPTQYLSAGKLLAVVPASALAIPAQLGLRVYNPAPGGGYSAPATLAVVAASDAGSSDASADSGDATGDSEVIGDAGGSDAIIDGSGSDASGSDATGDSGADAGAALAVGEIAPSVVFQWSGAVTATLSGKGFAPGCQVLLSTTAGPTPLEVTFVSPQQLLVSLNSPLFETTGQRVVMVQNPGGATAGPLIVQVQAMEGWGPPAILALTPSSTSLDAPTQTLQIAGNHLAGGATVVFGATPLATTWKSMYLLEAQLSTAAHPQEGPVTVTVTNPVAAGGGTASTTFVVTPAGNPVPWLQPLVAPGGLTVKTSASDVKLSLEGHNFLPSTQVRVNGQAIPTAMSPKLPGLLLEATLPAALLATPGVHSLDSFNPAPGGGSSPAIPLTVQAAVPLPVITALDPPEVKAGSSNAWIILKGSGFLPWSTVSFAGKAPTTTTYRSPSELLILVQYSELKSAGPREVLVSNADQPAKISAPLAFQVVAGGNSLPFVNTLTPAQAAKGSTSVKISGAGGAMLAGARVWVGGVPRLTLPAAATTFTLTLSGTDLATAGTFELAVQNPAPGGGFSQPKQFSVQGSNLSPVLQALKPAVVGTGTGALTLDIAMTQWTPKTTAHFTIAGKTWSLACSPPTATGCKVSLPALLFAAPLSASVKLINPGALQSAALTFSVESGLPTPQLSAATPGLIKLKSTGQKLTVSGSGFCAQSSAVETTTATSLQVLSWSPTELVVALPDALLASATTLQVVVSNPALGSPAKGGGSTAAAAVLVQPQPAITALTPATVKAMTVVKGLAVSGSDLDLAPGAKVFFGGENFAAAKVLSATQLLVDVPPALTAVAGKVPLSVQIPGFAPSNTLVLTVEP